MGKISTLIIHKKHITRKISKKETSWRNSTSRAIINGSSVVQTSYVIQATSVKTAW